MRKNIRNRLISFVMIVTLIISSTAISFAGQAKFYLENAERGSVGVSYKGDKRAKLIIEKDDAKFTYDLNSKGVREYYGLQLGDGIYKLKVYSHVRDTLYKLEQDTRVDVRFLHKNSVFLSSVQNINWNSDSAAVKLAEKLTKGTEGSRAKTAALWSHFLGGYRYDFEKIPTMTGTYLPAVDRTYSEKKGVCYDFASMYAAMLRSQGIPTKLVTGYMVGHENPDQYHAWNEVWIDSEKRWIVIDVTNDIGAVSAGKRPKMEENPNDYIKNLEY